MIAQFYDFKTNYLNVESWRKWYVDLVMDETRGRKRWQPGNRKEQDQKKQQANEQLLKSVDYDDELALEVLAYRKNLVDFGESSVTRAPRPSRVLYRVGQVIRHKHLDLVGVIIGWDERAMAPASWIDRNYDFEEVWSTKQNSSLPI